MLDRLGCNGHRGAAARQTAEVQVGNRFAGRGRKTGRRQHPPQRFHRRRHARRGQRRHLAVRIGPATGFSVVTDLRSATFPKPSSAGRSDRRSFSSGMPAAATIRVSPA